MNPDLARIKTSYSYALWVISHYFPDVVTPTDFIKFKIPNPNKVLSRLYIEGFIYKRRFKGPEQYYTINQRGIRLAIEFEKLAEKVLNDEFKRDDSS